jgi:hypothetical protein
MNPRRPKQDVVPEGVDPKPVNLANEQFRKTFANGAYTTLDFWISKRGLTYKQYLLDRACILDKDDYTAYKERSAEDGIQDPAGHEFPKTIEWLWQFLDDVLTPVVHTGTGRCTSFAIQTVDAIQSQQEGSFNFDYYRLETTTWPGARTLAPLSTLAVRRGRSFYRVERRLTWCHPMRGGSVPGLSKVPRSRASRRNQGI